MRSIVACVPVRVRAMVFAAFSLLAITFAINTAAGQHGLTVLRAAFRCSLP
jgi:hypothetical protein